MYETKRAELLYDIESGIISSQKKKRKGTDVLLLTGTKDSMDRPFNQRGRFKKEKKNWNVKEI